jgi:hypothetical protein
MPFKISKLLCGFEAKAGTAANANGLPKTARRLNRLSPDVKISIHKGVYIGWAKQAGITRQ